MAVAEDAMAFVDIVLPPPRKLAFDARATRYAIRPRDDLGATLIQGTIPHRIIVDCAIILLVRAGALRLLLLSNVSCVVVSLFSLHFNNK